MQETKETRVQTLGQEDPLEEVMATFSSILAWRILWTEEPGRLQSMALQSVGHNWNYLECMLRVMQIAESRIWDSQQNILLVSSPPKIDKNLKKWGFLWNGRDLKHITTKCNIWISLDSDSKPKHRNMLMG